MNTIEQPEFDLRRLSRGSLAQHVERFVTVLDTQRGWLTADQLLGHLHLRHGETSKRFLRRLSEEAGGRVISGQRGYRATAHASAGEIQHAAAWLRHQAIRMDLKARAILACGHRSLHTPLNNTVDKS